MVTYRPSPSGTSVSDNIFALGGQRPDLSGLLGRSTPNAGGSWTDFLGGAGGDAALTAAQQLAQSGVVQNPDGTFSRLPSFSSSSSVNQSLADPAQLALSWAQLQQSILESNAKIASDQQNLQFLRDQLQVQKDANRSADAARTAALQEQISSRIASNQLQQAGMVQDAKQLQAQLDQAAAFKNADLNAQASQINEQRRSANLEQQRQVANDIASYAAHPGSVGQNAAFLLAGGANPLSTAITGGQSGLTNQSLMPLQLLLGTQEQLRQGPQWYNYTPVQAPQVGTPQFLNQQQGAPGQPQMGTPAPGGGGGMPQGQNAGDIGNLLRGGAGGGVLQTGGNNFTIDAGGSLVPVTAAANGFDGTVTQPTLFLAGEQGPENVSINPYNTGNAVSTDKARNFLDTAFNTALSQTPFQKLPTPVALSSPGTNPYLLSIGAGLAALRGFDPGLYLNEAQSLAPVGLGGNTLTRRSR